MTSVIRPFVDKENASAVGIVPRSKGVAFGKSGIAGSKIFQKSHTPHSVPRKALGNVNNGTGSARTALGDINNTIKKSSDVGPTKNLFTCPNGAEVKNVLKPTLPRKVQNRDPGQKVKVKTQTKPKRQVKEPEIENMPMYPPMEDDFEDIVPKSERVSSYLDRLISWRPSKMCSMGINYDSDDEPYTKPEPVEIECPYVDDEAANLPELVDEPLMDIPLPSLADLGMDIDGELTAVPDL